MQTHEIERIIYQITVEDLQKVVHDDLNRTLTDDEINLLEEKIEDSIDWYDIISMSILNNIHK